LNKQQKPSLRAFGIQTFRILILPYSLPKNNSSLDRMVQTGRLTSQNVLVKKIKNSAKKLLSFGTW